MSIGSGLLRLFRAKPQHPIGPDGRMALADHLRELRARLLMVSVALVIGIVVAWFFYEPLFDLVRDTDERLDIPPGCDRKYPEKCDREAVYLTTWGPDLASGSPLRSDAQAIRDASRRGTQLTQRP